ncbi:MAG: redoxin domain-containing protein [Euryarchaeota archaeon]|nr:redoxin domain-containing protein [Euryarchaeota archaeon]
MSLSRFPGKVVVIHFVILVCCSYSALEVYYMEEIEASVKDNVAFLSIALDSPYNYYSPEEFRKIMEFNWTLALDFEGTVTRLYEAEETSTFVIDREGFIRYRDDKMTDAETLSAWLEKVM